MQTASASIQDLQPTASCQTCRSLPFHLPEFTDLVRSPQPYDRVRLYRWLQARNLQNGGLTPVPFSPRRWQLPGLATLACCH